MPSGDAHLSALLTEGEFDVYSLAAFGLGDPEMPRDKDNVMGISKGARVDAYCRTSILPSESALAVTWNRVFGDVWRLNLSAETLDGFYDIVKVSSGAGPEVSDPADMAVSFSAEGGAYPHLADVVSSFYSVYVTVEVVLEYPGLVGDTAEFTVTVRQLGGLRTIQEYLARNDVRNKAQDLLVKAPVPCFVEVRMALNTETVADRPEIAAVQQLVADTINGFPVGRGLVSASDIAYSVRNAYPDFVLDLPLYMRGSVLLPDGSRVSVTAVDGELKALTAATLGVSPRNTAFFCSAADVSVTVNDSLV
jgi:hypothetical protein